MSMDVCYEWKPQRRCIVAQSPSLLLHRISRRNLRRCRSPPTTCSWRRLRTIWCVGRCGGGLLKGNPCFISTFIGRGHAWVVTNGSSGYLDVIFACLCDQLFFAFIYAINYSLLLFMWSIWKIKLWDLRARRRSCVLSGHVNRAHDIGQTISMPLTHLWQ